MPKEQRHEIPEGFKEMMREMLGEAESSKFIESIDGEAAVSVRLNPRKNHPGIFDDTETVEWNKQGRYLPERPLFTADPLLHAGAYYVQEASSMIYGQAIEKISKLEGGRPLKVVDMCAAPGGKTTSMIDCLPEGSLVVANEIIGKRRRILEENLYKWGYPHIIITGTDTSAFRNFPDEFDIVAVDAPCSGEGMMRKDDDARAQWSPKLIQNCSSLQKQILSNAIECLKPGGYLIYSTCTYNHHEDEENAQMLAEEYGLIPTDLQLEGPAKEVKAIAEKFGPRGSLRFMPHISRGEGLYFSCFQKPHDAEGWSGNAAKSGKREKSSGGRNKKGTDNSIPKEIAGWLDGVYRLIEREGKVRALSGIVGELYERLQEKIKSVQAGIVTAEKKGNKYLPEAALAHSTAYRKESHPYVDLSKEEALRYLRKESLTLPEDTPRGIVCAGYEGEPLGFLNNLGSRANNLYPSEWKINQDFSLKS